MFELVRAISLDAAAGRARGRAHVPAAPWLADHFPGSPIVPGSVLVELCAQIAGPLTEGSRNPREPRYLAAVLGGIRTAVFRSAVAAPTDLAIEARLTRVEASSSVCRVEIGPTGVVAATAELVFAFVEVDAAAWAHRERRVAAWLEAW